ncbi:MAG: hypothetical protein AAF487_09730 [Bacteroidota bacterium]
MKKFPFFVFTIFWLGFLVAVSFFTTPIKFQVNSIDLFEGVALGKLTFNYFNKLELFFLIPLLIDFIINPSKPVHRAALLLLFGMLACQAVYLLPAMSAITDVVIETRTPSNSSLHMIYVIFEVLKLICLVLISRYQIKAWKSEYKLNTYCNSKSSVV